ncbi:MAG: hypothetical protein M1829_003473 [Trizodia sp. TS-e1964]|nr:MAG: hypothetical protein M1829_003473 [Trizodia sp. TS-e1964]
MASPASSSVGSDIFALTALLCIFALVLLLLRYFVPLRTTPAYLLVSIFLALAIPASTIILVPIDLASRSSSADLKETRGVWLPQPFLLVAWRITYWLCFALTWVILPLLGSYSDAGFREPRARLLYSLHQNGRYQLIVLGSGSIGLVYFFSQSGFNPQSFKALVMALAYCWGLILAIYLMGHGLVAIPRRLFRSASISGSLKRIQAHAPKVHDRLTDAVQELEELELQVAQLRQRKNGSAKHFEEWIEEITELSNLPKTRLHPLSSNSAATPKPVPTVITEGYLADLTQKIQRARHKRLRFIDTWDRLVHQATKTQAILDSAPSRRLQFSAVAPDAPLLQRISILTPYTRYLLHVRIIPGLSLALGGILSLASICIIWSELIKYGDPALSIINYTVVHHPKSNPGGQISFLGQMIAAWWISYMCLATLTSLSDARVWGNRALVRRNTYPESACWYAFQVARLTIPLAYNFMTFLPPTIYQRTVFFQFLGRLIVLTPLGKGFDYFFPIFILIPVCATLFNLYGKVKSLFGFDAMEEDDEEALQGDSAFRGWREGRDLIERDLSSRTTLGGISNVALDGHRAYRPGAASTRPSIYTDSATFTPSTNATITTTITGGTSTAPSTRATPRAQPKQSARPPIPYSDNPGEDEADNENFFTGFAHRVRNTFDTADLKPKWMPKLNFGAGESSAGDSGNSALTRWFGGRGENGRVRLP